MLCTCAGAAAQDGLPPALVVTEPVVREAISEKVELLGTVRPIHDSRVASEVEGRVAARHVENGDRVAKGQVLVRLDSTRLEKDLERVTAQLKDAEAQLELSLIQERRARDLFDQDILSQGEMDEAVARRQSLEGRASSIEARISSIEDDIARTEIRAPFTGIVTSIRTEVGEWINRGDWVVRLSDLSTVEIRLDVPEHYFRKLSAGAVAPAVVDAIPGLTLDAKIFAVVPQADHEARTFPVLVRAANPGGQVASGMLARVRLTLSAGDEVLIVPKDAIVRQAQQEILWIVDNGAARAVSVRTGRGVGERVEVEGDIEEGDIVVVRGNERLAPGQPVIVETSDASVTSTTRE
jgi:membrane fusion protein (multidrug efflux system)